MNTRRRLATHAVCGHRGEHARERVRAAEKEKGGERAHAEKQSASPRRVRSRLTLPLPIFALRRHGAPSEVSRWAPATGTKCASLCCQTPHNNTYAGSAGHAGRCPRTRPLPSGFTEVDKRQEEKKKKRIKKSARQWIPTSHRSVAPLRRTRKEECACLRGTACFAPARLLLVPSLWPAAAPDTARIMTAMIVRGQRVPCGAATSCLQQRDLRWSHRVGLAGRSVYLATTLSSAAAEEEQISSSLFFGCGYTVRPSWRGSVVSRWASLLLLPPFLRPFCPRGAFCGRHVSFFVVVVVDVVVRSRFSCPSPWSARAQSEKELFTPFVHLAVCRVTQEKKVRNVWPCGF